MRVSHTMSVPKHAHAAARRTRLLRPRCPPSGSRPAPRSAIGGCRGHLRPPPTASTVAQPHLPRFASSAHKRSLGTGDRGLATAPTSDSADVTFEPGEDKRVVWQDLKVAAAEIGRALEFRRIKDPSRLHFQIVTPEEYAAKPRRGGRPRHPAQLESVILLKRRTTRCDCTTWLLDTCAGSQIRRFRAPKWTRAAASIVHCYHSRTHHGRPPIS